MARATRAAVGVVTVIDPARAWPHVDEVERDRFATRVFALADTGCWLWIGGIEPDGGYGRFRRDDASLIAAHRWSYLASRGALIEPVVRHHCDVRCCVRPDHLVEGTQAQNIADTVRRGRWTSHARVGPRAWPDLAFALRTAAQDGDVALIAELLRRPIQLELWPATRSEIH